MSPVCEVSWCCSSQSPLRDSWGSFYRAATQEMWSLTLFYQNTPVHLHCSRLLSSIPPVAFQHFHPHQFASSPTCLSSYYFSSSSVQLSFGHRELLSLPEFYTTNLTKCATQPPHYQPLPSADTACCPTPYLLLSVLTFSKSKIVLFGGFVPFLPTSRWACPWMPPPPPCSRVSVC